MRHERSFQSPLSLADACSIMDRVDNSALVAGGQWIVPLLKSGDVTAHHLISLKQIAELRGIEYECQTVTIGAGETHQAIARSPILKSELPIIASIAGKIGDPATRNRGTLGGAFGSDARRSDYAGAWVGLNGKMLTTQRTLSSKDFFSVDDPTPLNANEIIVSLNFQVPKWAAVQKIPHPAANHAEAGVFVCRLQDGSWRVVAFGDKSGPRRLSTLETQLEDCIPRAQLKWPEEMVQTEAFFTSRLSALLDRALSGVLDE